MKINNNPLIMGIVNINNESFYSNSRCLNPTAVINRIDEMVCQGADIIDIGACSTRPGSTPVTAEQEWDYLKEPLEAIKSANYPIKFSIDTFRADIVKKAYDIIGDFIVNDISSGEDDPAMLECVGGIGLQYIAMHKRGTPNTMGSLCNYPNGVVNEVTEYFMNFHKNAERYKISNYIIDPGFGFAKTIEQNYELFRGMPLLKENLEKFTGVKQTILVGISRKTMIWKPLGVTPNEALNGTIALNLQSILLGGDILRVHDVAPAKECAILSKFFI